MKRIFLFVATNIAVLALLAVTMQLLGIQGLLDEQGVNLDLGALLVFSAVLGFGGALISLAISKWSAKRMTGARVIEQPANEIEAWLVSHSGSPIPINQTFLDKLGNPLVVHELAAFNVELNSEPLQLTGRALTTMEKDLQKIWDNCRHIANDLAVDMMMIGILPSIQDRHLSVENMSKLNRYRALNEQIIKHRHGLPLQLDISGRDSIQTTHRDVMLESACTSFQLHLQTPLDKATDLMNLSMLVSAPMVAVSANSPYLFGKDLWDENRIPLFEQSVAIDKHNYRRVTFGYGYIKSSVMECFEENLKHYPILVPINKDIDPSFFNHLRFHNGTIWRWNRPLIGFDKDNKPHLRIEHRVIPSGPTVTDSVANAAFYFGLINGLED